MSAPHVTAILGAGVMGETLLSGLIRAGRPVDQLLVGEKRADRAGELHDKYGVAVVSNLEATQRAYFSNRQQKLLRLRRAAL